MTAETIAGKLEVQTKSITNDDAQYLGYLAAFASLDNPASNDKTRAVFMLVSLLLAALFVSDTGEIDQSVGEAMVVEVVRFLRLD